MTQKKISGIDNIADNITKDNFLYVLDDIESDGMRDVFEKFKREIGSTRIHLNTDRDFGGHVANFIGAINNRAHGNFIPSDIVPLSIAFIDGSVSGFGRRGMLVTRLGLVGVGDYCPLSVFGMVMGLMTHWRMFFKFADFDHPDGLHFVTCDTMKMKESDEIARDVRDKIFSENTNDEGTMVYGPHWYCSWVDDNDCDSKVDAMLKKGLEIMKEMRSVLEGKHTEPWIPR